jgi:hypothetical protein
MDRKELEEAVELIIAGLGKLVQGQQEMLMPGANVGTEEDLSSFTEEAVAFFNPCRFQIPVTLRT